MTLAGVVLAAGEGRRMHPLTRFAPKALCPIGNVPLVDQAINRLAAVTNRVAVNVHHHRARFETHLGDRVHVSIEDRAGLGTAGALSVLRPWLDGDAALITNADAWLGVPADVDLTGFVEGWDGARVRLLCVEEATRGDFGSLRFCGVSLMPWATLANLAATPSGLYEVSWRAEWEVGRLDLVRWDGAFIDCGTVVDYLEANLASSAGESVVAPGVAVEGFARRCVLWAGAEVPAGEELSDAIRGPGWTILVR